MASPVTKTFQWSAGLDSFSWTETGSAEGTSTWSASGGRTDAGCLSVSISGRNKDQTGYWSRTLNFEAMGVPSGATITGITSASLYSKCVTYVVGSGSAVTAGTATLSDGTTTVTLASQRTITATDANYVQQTGTNNTSLNWASTQNVTITINQLVNGGNNGSAAVDVRVDDLALTIAYTEPATQLVPANTAHAHSAGAPTLTYTAPPVTLTVSSATHALSDTGGAASTVLIPGVGVVPAEDAVYPGGGVAYGGGLTLTATEPQSDALTIQNAAHVLADTGPVALTQANTLAAASTAHALSDTGPLALTQASTLTAQNATHAVADTGPLDVAQDSALVAQDAAHALSDTGPLGLAQASTLAAADTSHALSSDNVALSEAATLTGADAAHGHSAGSVALTQDNALTVADASHDHSATAPALTQANVLAASSAAHAQAASSTDLTQASVLVSADAVHAVSDTGPFSLDQSVELVLADAAHGHAVESLALVQASALGAQDAAHAHSAGSVVLGVQGSFELVVGSAGHGQAAESPNLLQANSLSLQNAAHAQSAESAALAQASILATSAAAHAQSAEAVALVQANVLSAASAAHAQASESPTLTWAGSLVVASAAHAQASDSPTLSVDGSSTELTVLNAAHAQSAGATIGTVLVPGVGVVTLDGGVLPDGGLLMGAALDLIATAGAGLLVVSNATHAQTAGAVSLSQVAAAWDVLVPGVGVVPQTETVVIPGAGVISAATGETIGLLTVSNGTHVQTAEDLALDVDYEVTVSWVHYDGELTYISVADATHSQYQWDTVQLTQHSTLDVADAAHSHAANLLSFWQVGPSSASHAHSANKISLDVGLRVFSALHEHAASGGDVIRLSLVLKMQNALHSHSADSTYAAQDLVVLGALHSVRSTNPILTEKFSTVVLTVRDGTHAHSADGVLVDSSYLLELFDAGHSQTVEELLLDLWLSPADAAHGVTDTVSVSEDLRPADAVHAHEADLLRMDTWELSLENSYHSHEADAVDLTQEGVLSGLDAVHAHYVDSVWSFGATWTKDVGRWQNWSRHTVGNGGWTPVAEAGNGWREVS